MGFTKHGDPLPIVKVIISSEEALEEKEKIKKLEEEQQEKPVEDKKYQS
jgi:hypothetical protein